MCFQWVNDKIKKFNCFDISVLKLCVFAFALLVAKFWPAILSLEWYWYAIAFAVTYGYMIAKMFGK